MKLKRPPGGFRERYLDGVRRRRDLRSPTMRFTGWLIVFVCAEVVGWEIYAFVASVDDGQSTAELVVVSIGAALVGFVVAWTMWHTRRGTAPLPGPVRPRSRRRSRRYDDDYGRSSY